MHESILRAVTEAASMALATSGPAGLNVVPLSVAAVHDDEVYLYDFFMQKAAQNIKAEPSVALACWNGFAGVQIKGSAVYDNTSEAYETAVAEMQVRFPERTLHGLIRLTPSAAYDLAPGASGADLLQDKG